MPLAFLRNYFEYYYLACCVAYLVVVAVAYALFFVKVFWSFINFKYKGNQVSRTSTVKNDIIQFKRCYYAAFVF